MWAAEAFRRPDAVPLIVLVPLHCRPFHGLETVMRLVLGSAALHPRLYAIARCGLN